MNFEEVLVTVGEFCKALGDENYLSIDPMFTDPENGDLTLKESGPAKDAGTMGLDLGISPVQPFLMVGWNENQTLFDNVLAGDVPVSSTEVGTHAIVVELNRTTRQELVVTVKCVAGNAKEDSDINVKKTITLAPDEKKKLFNVTVKLSEMIFDQLVAFKIVSVTSGEIGLVTYMSFAQ